ncbi:uncharacterized protein MKK02DRAFT_42239 [Dioszegia hungarica]|uniref:Uncharacterized protein n=1 Tax=Dioszegia hungarica TaxID=4972 RepID=A0AA38HAQ6_9TREE|nr:uncharacterized protein MKK02DRAFT_42239 [Dioszegia hungarica]KAI9637862.1 hypothetical protein MKK02DRAFT_42239 [Dioszegia hungarica]
MPPSSPVPHQPQYTYLPDMLLRARVDPFSLSDRLLRVEALQQLKTRREASVGRKSQRSSQLSDVQVSMDISIDGNLDDSRARLVLETRSKGPRPTVPAGDRPSQLDSDDDRAWAVLSAQLRGTDSDTDKVDLQSDTAMRSEPPEDGDESEAETDEDIDIGTGDAEMAATLGAQCDGDENSIDPTLRAANAKMKHLRRQLIGLQQARTAQAASKRRVNRISSRLKEEQLVSAAYQRTVRSTQQELAALQEKVKKGGSGSGDETCQLRSAKAAAEVRWAVAESRLRFAQGARAYFEAGKLEAESRRDEAIEKAKSADRARQVAEQRTGEMERQKEAVLSKNRELLARIGRLEQSQADAELRAAASSSAHEAGRRDSETRATTAEAEARIARVAEKRAKVAKASSDAWLAQSKTIAAHSRALADHAILKNEGLEADRQDLRQQMKAATEAWAKDRAALQRSVEGARGRAADADERRVMAETAKEKAERKLDVMKEAHDMEREMYVERIRDLTGRGKAKQSGAGDEGQ